MKKIYLAGPFFNPEQVSVASRIEILCCTNNLEFFSPRLECLCPPDAAQEQRTNTFQLNVQHIREASYIFARIDDFDPGTMWELGYAFAHHIPAYAYTTFPGRGLNLMLAESGLLLVRGWPNIERFLAGASDAAVKWTGKII